MQRLWVINGNNINYDHDITASTLATLKQGVLEWFDVVGSWASATINPWKALIKCTRTNWETFMAYFQNTEALPVNLTGTKKVYISVDQAKIDNGLANNEDGTGIAEITTGASYPSWNYVALYDVVSWVITNDIENVSLTDEIIAQILWLVGEDFATIEYVDQKTAELWLVENISISDLVVMEDVLQGDIIRWLKNNLIWNQFSNIGDVVANTRLDGLVYFDWSYQDTIEFHCIKIWSTYENLVVEIQELNWNVVATGTIAPSVFDADTISTGLGLTSQSSSWNPNWVMSCWFRASENLFVYWFTSNGGNWPVWTVKQSWEERPFAVINNNYYFNYPMPLKNGEDMKVYRTSNYTHMAAFNWSWNGNRVVSKGTFFGSTWWNTTSAWYYNMSWIIAWQLKSVNFWTNISQWVAWLKRVVFRKWNSVVDTGWYYRIYGKSWQQAINSYRKYNGSVWSNTDLWVMIKWNGIPLITYSKMSASNINSLWWETIINKSPTSAWNKTIGTILWTADIPSVEWWKEYYCSNSWWLLSLVPWTVSRRIWVWQRTWKLFISWWSPKELWTSYAISINSGNSSLPKTTSTSIVLCDRDTSLSYNIWMYAWFEVLWLIQVSQDWAEWTNIVVANAWQTKTWTILIKEWYFVRGLLISPQLTYTWTATSTLSFTI